MAESILWQELRAGRNGMRFLRQHVIGDYIVDFVSVHEGLIIEVDGGYHSECGQQISDEARQQWLEAQGYHVMRFSNEEVINELDRVLDEIDTYFY